MWGEMFMAGSGKKSEASESENKYIRKIQRVNNACGFKTCWQTVKWPHRLDKRRELSDGLSNITTAKADDESLPFPLASANS